jgi:rubrerythrin
MERYTQMVLDPENTNGYFIRGSLAQTAYRAWAAQARRERRFNIARLLDALAAARSARAEHAFCALNQVDATSLNVERALAGLEPDVQMCGPVTGTTEISRSLLQRALVAVREGRDMRAEELGDIYVCTTCGELREGQLTSACPRCGTVPEAHKAFKALEAMGTLGPHAIMHYLESTEVSLRKLLTQLDDAMLSRRIAPDKPSLKELCGHLADVDAVFRERAWLLLETDHPELPPAHPPRLDAAGVYRNMELEHILNLFHSTRKQTLSLLRGLTSAAWHRTGHHELYGEVNLLHQGNWVVHHERNHLIDMAQPRHDLCVGAESGYNVAELAEVVVDDVNEGE